MENAANDNLAEFDEWLSNFHKFKDSAKLFPSLSLMDTTFQNLTADGTLGDNTSTFQYKALQASITEATNIYSKPNKSIDDITNFFEIQKNFKKTIKMIKGEDDCVR